MSHELFPDFEKMPTHMKLTFMVQEEKEKLEDHEAYIPSEETKALMRQITSSEEDYADICKIFGVGMSRQEYEAMIDKEKAEEALHVSFGYDDHTLTEVITMLVGIERSKIQNKDVKYEPSKEVLGLIDRLIAEKEASSGRHLTADEKDTIYKVFGLYMSDNEFLEYGMKAFLEAAVKDDMPQDIGIGDDSLPSIEEVANKFVEMYEESQNPVFDPQKYKGVKMDISKEDAYDICCRLIHIINAMGATNKIVRGVRPGYGEYGNRQMDTVAGALLAIAGAYNIDIGTLEARQ